MDAWAFTLDGTGNLHVAQYYDSAILKYSPDGELLGHWYIVVDGDTLDAGGLTYVKQHFVALAWSRVIVLDENYTAVRSWPERHPRDFVTGGDLIDADAAGNIYVLDNNYDRVDVYGFDGSFRNEWQVEAPDTLGQGRLSGIAVTDAGVAYVSDFLGNRILMYSSDGKLLRTLGVPGSKPGELNWPSGLDIAGSVLYVADMANIRVQKFTLYGGYLSNFNSLGAYGQDIDVPRSVSVYKNHVFVMHGKSIIRYDYSD